ncbi:Uncharacterised protein [Salmonella enterica subsp. enterica serovar Typhimurium str. DT104]|nr:Uncharacterised protein [Salmonella enterica subsp. enterica serovar Typhimurium str. DT104]
MLDARRGNLWRDNGKTCPGAGKCLYILRIKYGFCLHFITCGDQFQRLDLADINTEVTNGHPFRQFSGVERVQRNLSAYRAGGGF